MHSKTLSKKKSLQFKASLAYMVSSIIVRITKSLSQKKKKEGKEGGERREKERSIYLIFQNSFTFTEKNS